MEPIKMSLWTPIELDPKNCGSFTGLVGIYRANLFCELTKLQNFPTELICKQR